MDRGIIMELKGKYAVVLTPEGEFKKTRLPAGEYQLGEEVQVKNSVVYPLYRWGAVAAVLIIALMIPYLYNNIAVADSRAFAYVEMDVNPSVEYTINRFERIIEARGLNSEGEQVLEGGQLKGRHIKYGIEYFTLKAYQLGYAGAPGKDHIIVTTVFEDQKDQKLEKSVAQTISRTVEKNAIEVKVNTLEATKQIKEEAQRAGISSGKYLILLEATDEELPVDVDDMKESSAVQVIRDAGGDIDRIIERVNKKDRDLNELLSRYMERAINRHRNDDEEDDDNDYGDDNDDKGRGKGNGRDKWNLGEGGQNDRDDRDDKNRPGDNGRPGQPKDQGKGNGDNNHGKDSNPDRGQGKDSDDDDRDGNDDDSDRKNGRDDKNNDKRPGSDGQRDWTHNPGKGNDDKRGNGSIPEPGKDQKEDGKDNNNGLDNRKPGKGGRDKESNKDDVDNNKEKSADNRNPNKGKDNKNDNGKRWSNQRDTKKGWFDVIGKRAPFVEDLIMELFN